MEFSREKIFNSLRKRFYWVEFDKIDDAVQEGILRYLINKGKIDIKNPESFINIVSSNFLKDRLGSKFEKYKQIPKYCLAEKKESGVNEEWNSFMDFAHNLSPEEQLIIDYYCYQNGNVKRLNFLLKKLKLKNSSFLSMKWFRLKKKIRKLWKSGF